VTLLRDLGNRKLFSLTLENQEVGFGEVWASACETKRTFVCKG
jgi:hypothetical protein